MKFMFTFCASLLFTIASAQQLHFFYDSTEALNYGCRINMGFTITQPNKKTTATDGFLLGDVPWKNFDIEVVGGRFEIKDEILVKQGVVVIGNRQQLYPGNIVRIRVRHKKLNILGEYKIPVSYAGLKVAWYKPAKGKEGKKAGGGLLGAIFKFLDSNDGNIGGNGVNGPDLKVSFFTTIENDDTILVSAVTNKTTNSTDTFYTNPLKGQIKIMADGADGGDGSAGGQTSNHGGNGGNGGKGGNGGSIEVYGSSLVLKYKKCIVLSNKGGNGGNGGRGGDGNKTSGHLGLIGEDGKDGPAIYYMQ